MTTVIVTKNDKIATHRLWMDGMPKVVVGENPFSKSGSANGKWLDGKVVFRASLGSLKLENAVAKLNAGLKLAQETGLDQEVEL